MTDETLWAMSPHTRTKHELLTGYLDAWFPILALGGYKKLVFLDAFAGPGVYEGGEPGSPRQAVERLLHHRSFAGLHEVTFRFIVNELDPDRYASLIEVLDDVKAQRGGQLAPNVHLKVHNKNFVDLAAELAEEIAEFADGEHDYRRRRAAGARSDVPMFAFIDPFGYKSVPMDVIADVTRGQVDLFMYFDFNSVNRFANAGTSADTALAAFFGSDEYRQAPKGDERKEWIRALFEKQLRSRCGYEYVLSFEMVNRTNHTGSFMFFATRHRRGLEVMKDVMWKVAPTGDFSFHDNLDGQGVFFADEPDLAPLGTALLNHHTGQTVSVDDLELFVLAETPYRAAHLRTALKALAAEGVLTCDHPRRNAFPKSANVTFVTLAKAARLREVAAAAEPLTLFDLLD